MTDSKNTEPFEAVPPDELLCLINHIMLPPGLPSSQDGFAIGDELLIAVSQTLATFGAMDGSFTSTEKGRLNETKKMIDNMQEVHDFGGSLTLGGSRLQTLLDFPVDTGETTTIPLYIEAQNAGVIVRKFSNSVAFAAFELSPANKEVYASQGRLKRTFPSSAVTVPLDQINNITITTALAKMAGQAVEGMQPTAYKAHQNHDEDRDTTMPCIVSEYFMGYLIALGKPLDAPFIY